MEFRIFEFSDMRCKAAIRRRLDSKNPQNIRSNSNCIKNSEEINPVSPRLWERDVPFDNTRFITLLSRLVQAPL